jgi:hypothetical protein
VAQAGDLVDAGAASQVLPFRHFDVLWDDAVARIAGWPMRLNDPENGPQASPPMRFPARPATLGTPAAKAVRSARLQRCTH